MNTPLFVWIPTLVRTGEDTNRKNENNMEQQMDGMITMFNIYTSRLHSKLHIPARRPPRHPSPVKRTGTLPTDSIQGDKDTGQVSIAGPSNQKYVEPSRYSSFSRNRSDCPDSSVPPSPVCSTSIAHRWKVLRAPNIFPRMRSYQARSVQLSFFRPLLVPLKPGCLESRPTRVLQTQQRKMRLRPHVHFGI
jgi:hypothetical protein